MSDKKEAYAKIEELLAQADKALSKAAEIAELNDLEFSWSGPTYGMGGDYTPESLHGGSYSEPGWQASSQSC